MYSKQLKILLDISDFTKFEEFQTFKITNLQYAVGNLATIIEDFRKNSCSRSFIRSFENFIDIILKGSIESNPIISFVINIHRNLNVL